MKKKKIFYISDFFVKIIPHTPNKAESDKFPY